MSINKLYAAARAGGEFELIEVELDLLGDDEVEIKVHSCGLCHSDLSMLKNDWGMTKYPFVAGHEAVGEVIALGKQAKGLKIGDKVGLGWNAETCGYCQNCISGSQINCPNLVGTIVGRHGGFADRVRSSWEWAIKLPESLNLSKAGPLFCGGITVFNPFVQNNISPTDKIGIVGIGGLGHLALQFADKWGCEVTAFTTNLEKKDELISFGADFVVETRNETELTKLAGKFDMILVTVNAALNWDLYLQALGPKGKLHVVGAILEPMSIGAFSLIMNQKSVTGTATGSPAVVTKMLEFCARHNIEAVTENFPMSKINDAFAHLEAGNARYRIVLENDFV